MSSSPSSPSSSLPSTPPPTPSWLRSLRTLVRANRLSNARLARAMQGMSDADFQAPRVSFFPSLSRTLTHLLAVDRYYLAALRGEADMVAQYRQFVPCTRVADWAERQQQFDEELIAYAESLAEADVLAPVHMDRGREVQTDRVGHVLQHLLMHQTHHRGQVHAMLSGTSIAPPQLDEFLMPSEAHLRVADLQALGWQESDVFGPA